MIRLKAKNPSQASKIEFLQLYLVDLRDTLLQPESVTEETVRRLNHDFDQFIDEMHRLKSTSPQLVSRIEFLIKNILELRTYFKRSSFLIEARTAVYRNGVNIGKSNQKQIVRVPY